MSLSASRVLSPYQGLLLSTALCISCLVHTKKAHKESVIEENGYAFWTQHYFIEETVSHVAEYALAHLSSDDSVTDPNILSMNIVLYATIICLHQTLITMATSSKAPNLAAQRSKRETQCMDAMMNLSTVLRRINKSNIPKVRCFSKSDQAPTSLSYMA
jgi:hypothetical protein